MRETAMRKREQTSGVRWDLVGVPSHLKWHHQTQLSYDVAVAEHLGPLMVLFKGSSQDASPGMLRPGLALLAGKAL